MTSDLLDFFVPSSIGSFFVIFIWKVKFHVSRLKLQEVFLKDSAVRASFGVGAWKEGVNYQLAKVLCTYSEVYK